MTAKSILTIHQLLKNESKLNSTLAESHLLNANSSEAAKYKKKAEDIASALYDFEQRYGADSLTMMGQAEAVKQHLEYLMDYPGANITIVIEDAEGKKSTAELYDHAALVQSLHDALSYFQSEL